MANRIVLHGGLGKCASTTIQALIQQNIDTLGGLSIGTWVQNQAGILNWRSPELSRLLLAEADKQKQTFPQVVSEGFLTPIAMSELIRIAIRRQDSKLINRIRLDFKDSVAKASCKTVVISAEAFWNECVWGEPKYQKLYMSALLYCLKPFECKLIAVLRRQDRLLESLYGLQISSFGETRTYRDFIAEYNNEKMNYLSFIEGIENAGFLPNLQLLFFENLKVSPDGFMDAIMKIIDERLSYSGEVSRLNTRLSSAALILLRHANRLGLNRDELAYLRHHLRAIQGPSGLDAYDGREAEHLSICKVHQKNNIQMFEKYFPKDPLRGHYAFES
jgi:hypothetical protein